MRSTQQIWSALNIVPWQSISEWRQVKNLLFQNNADFDDFRQESISQALETINVWKARGKLPLSVDSTAALFEIYLLDKRALIGEQDLKLLISMAMVRLVNGLADMQQKGAHAISVMHLARNIDLPRYFVDIRHSATHDTLPSLCVLRRACIDALQWLRVHYWDAYENYFDDLKGQIVDCLSRYKKLRKAQIREYQQSVTTDKCRITLLPLSADICTVTRELTSLLTEDLLTDFCQILIEEGQLVPRDLKKRFTAQAGVRDVLLAMWTPLLSSLNNLFPFFEELLSCIVVELSLSKSEDESYRETLAAWAKYLISELCVNFEEKSFMRMSQIVFRNTSLYTMFLAGILQSNMISLSEEDQSRFMSMLAVAEAFSMEPKSDDLVIENTSNPLEEAEDMERILEKLSSQTQEKKASNSAVSETGPWRIADDSSFWETERPFGICL